MSKKMKPHKKGTIKMDAESNLREMVTIEAEMCLKIELKIINKMMSTIAKRSQLKENSNQFKALEGTAMWKTMKISTILLIKT